MAASAGTIASGATPSCRVSVSKFSFWRGMPGSMVFATQPGEPCAVRFDGELCQARVVDAAEAYADDQHTGRSRMVARSLMLMRGPIGASQPPAPSTTIQVGGGGECVEVAADMGCIYGDTGLFCGDMR